MLGRELIKFGSLDVDCSMSASTSIATVLRTFQKCRDVHKQTHARPSSSLHQFEFGCALMSPRPSQLAAEERRRSIPGNAFGRWLDRVTGIDKVESAPLEAVGRPTTE